MFTRLSPRTRHVPKGYTHGIVVEAPRRTVYVAGQLGSDATGVIHDLDFSTQFVRALDNVIAVVREAGGGPESIAAMRIYITDFPEYRRSKEPIAVAWSARFADYYPAVAIVQVAALVDPNGKVEIEATAHV